jgi:hypothetical protein
MLSCKEVSLLLSRACDQRLSWRVRLAVRLHLLYCQGCTQFGKQLQFLRSAGQRFSDQLDIMPQQRLPEDARRRIRATLDRE